MAGRGADFCRAGAQFQGEIYKEDISVSMEFGVGSILDGKVTGITKFGAFVALPEGRSGLVHISEIAYTYVNEVSDYLKEGQEVKVKVIGIDQANRINLSIKKVNDPPQRTSGNSRATVRPARVDPVRTGPVRRICASSFRAQGAHRL